MNQLATRQDAIPALQMDEQELIKVLQTSLYPNASLESIKMVLGYCKASNLDPMQKPVHIVPMYDGKAKTMRDVIMPGIGLYRTQAARSGECAGVSEPDFGPDITANIGGTDITYPAWCKVTVKRRLPTGEVVDFTAKELWRENYAVRGGQDKSIAPNAMWFKRPYGQIAKCAEAQALRKAFPEIGSEPTAEEMDGKFLNDGAVIETEPSKVKMPLPKAKASDAIDQHTGEITDVQEKDQTHKPSNTAPAGFISVGQQKWIENKVNALNLDLSKTLASYQVEGLEKVTVEQFVEIKSELMSAA